MDSNRDEALRCIGIAKEAIALGNKERALKLIKIAQRLDTNLSVDDLIEACERINSPSPSPSENGNLRDRSSAVGTASEGRSYTEEHIQLIRHVNRSKDYYDVLSLEKSCSMEEIKKAYRKLSLRVHPDKNKATGAEEAFKKVSKAFKCLSEEDSRRMYDQTGFADEFEHNQQHVRRRRRTTTSGFYDDDFDPNEIFRAFFGQTSVFHSSQVFRTRGVHTQQQRTDAGGSGSSFTVLIQLAVVLLIILLAYSPTWEPEYSLQKSHTHQYSKVTEWHGVTFFVKSVDFDRSYPVGSESRASLEESVIEDYKNVLRRYCNIELQRRQWSRSLPTPNCDKYRSFGVA